ncbi:MAG: peptide chain release factor N(5)-glutamine methyltransferase [Bacteroidales bacterium]|nr:peptide chain release factor N(5)-glutamine methyltransferase [Bacteroidales bacterium]
MSPRRSSDSGSSGVLLRSDKKILASQAPLSPSVGGVTFRDYKALAVERLASLYPEAEARAIAVRLLTSRLNVPDYKVAAEPATAIKTDALAALEADLDRLAEGCPLQYALGYTEFAGLRIRVAPGCLIPRPETEEMVALIIDSAVASENLNILDLCTGSGCIAYALADAFPEAQVFACDLSEAALSIACKQRVKLPGARPVFFQADVLQAPPAGLPKFDLIVSNPPYVMESERAAMRSNVLDYEPAEALFVPDDDPLRFYAAIRRWADALLAPGGEIWLEINEKLGPETAAVFGLHSSEAEASLGQKNPRSASALSGASALTVQLLQDLSGKDRFLRIIK